MTKQEEAARIFQSGYSCAQSVFLPFAEELGLSREQALRLSAGFGAGIGRMRETCGAFCALTLLAGHVAGNEEGTVEGKQRIYDLVQEQATLFQKEFGSMRCADLLPDEIIQDGSTRPQERDAAYYAARPCERCVAFCAQAGEQLIRH